MSVRVETQLAWRGGEFAGEMKAAALDGLLDAGEVILEESGSRVPHDQGTLEGSGEVNPDGDGVIIFYDEPYAARQHEETKYRHPNGRQAKYLKRAVDEIGDGVLEAVADRIRGELGL